MYMYCMCTVHACTLLYMNYTYTCIILYPANVASRTGDDPETSNILTVRSDEHVASLRP